MPKNIFIQNLSRSVGNIIGEESRQGGEDETGRKLHVGSRGWCEGKGLLFYSCYDNEKGYSYIVLKFREQPRHTLAVLIISATLIVNPSVSELCAIIVNSSPFSLF